jgi:5-dehydro-4-deoxyglucarate dehydratase
VGVMMRPNELREKLQGVLAFVITPFRADHSLDVPGLELLVDRMVSLGIRAVCCAGGVGEFYSLTQEEYGAVAQATAGAAAGRATVIAGIGHSTRIAAEWARTAAKAGVDGLMVNPLYFVEPSVDGVVAHYRAIGEAAGLGMIAFSTAQFIYNLELMERLAEVPELAGLKDEIGNLNTFLTCRARLGDRFAWINGMAEPMVTPYFAAGARCFTTGLANFAPHIPTTVHQLAIAGDYEALEKFVSKYVRPLATLRSKRRGYSTAAIKEATSLMGLPAGPCRLPLLSLAPEDRKELEAMLPALQIPSYPLPSR